MPLKIGGQVFDSFDAAVSYVMRTKKIDREAAKRYVGSIEATQHGK